MKPGIGMVVNSAARAVKHRYLRRERFWQRYVPAEFVCVTTSLAELDAAIAHFQSARVRTIAVLGGDGSLHRLIDAVVHRYGARDMPSILALAGGTMNGIPKALGTGGDPEMLLRQAARQFVGGAPPLHPQQVLKIVDQAVDRARYGFSFATGLVYRALQSYYRTPDPGWMAAIRASLLPLRAALFGGTFFDGVKLSVSRQDTPWLADSHTLVASVLDHPLLWFRPFGLPLRNEKSFHVGATSMPPRQIALRLWSIFRGTCRHPGLRVGHVEDVAVAGEHNVGYLIDGELYPTETGFSVRLTAGPLMRFVVPTSGR